MSKGERGDMAPANRSPNDGVPASFGGAGSGTQANGWTSPIQAAAPAAKVNAANTTAIAAENGTPRRDATLSRFDVTYAIHPPVQRLDDPPRLNRISRNHTSKSAA